MSRMPSRGLVAISVTPLTPQGAIDQEGIPRLMDFYVDCGVTGITLLGVMGEANRMTDAEARSVVELAVASVDGRVPVIVGVSDSSLARLTDLAQHANELGCVGVLVQPLPGLQSDRKVADYFETVADHLGPDIEICVQDFPKANGVHISPEAWTMIVERCPTVTMLKAEDEPGLRKLSAIRRAERNGLRRVTILTGNNGIHLVQELRRGADGAMTGFAFPDVLAEVIRLHEAGDSDRAEDLFDQYLPLNRHEYRLGISMRKEILRRRGAIGSAHARHPAPGLDGDDLGELDNLIARLERATAPIGVIRGK